MISYILQIIGIIAIIWICALVIAHIILHTVIKYAFDGTDWTSIERETSIYNTEFYEWYIIPTISFHINFNDTTYPSFQITWLKWIFNISYHFKTEEEEEIEVEVRTKYIKSKK